LKQVFITGASSDIGVALCELYLAKGWRVVGHCNNGQDSFRRLADSTPNLKIVQIDFADVDALERKIEQARDLIEGSDALINAAAVLRAQPFGAITAHDLIESFSINVVPAILMTQLAAPAMAARGWGRIVNLSSIGVKFGGGSSSFGYSLTKHALEFLPADHKKWAAANVLLNAIRIGVTDTRIHRIDPTKDISRRVALIPMGRMATSSEMAKAIHWYGSEENTFTTGQTITVAGGE